MTDDEVNAMLKKDGKKTQDEFLQKEMTQQLVNGFLLLILEDWLSDKKDPKKIVDDVFKHWKKVLRKNVEPIIQQKTELLQSDIGKLLGLGAGIEDGEQIRLEFNQNLSEVAKKIRPYFDSLARGE